MTVDYLDPTLTPKNLSTDLGDGITLIDTAFQRPQMAACYLMEQDDEVAIIETGTKDTVPLIFDVLTQKKIAASQVKYVIVTHVHLDHAGGAGLLMDALPNATLIVHPKGQRHMVDPSKLQAGATAVYGEEEFNKTYGDLIAIAENRTHAPKDGEILKLGDRALTFIDTPGHARHHFCIYDELSKGIFTGDTFGLAYQELTNENGPFIFPTTTPVQFDPEALKASIKKIMSLNPESAYLTHYGKIQNLVPLADALNIQVDALVDIAHSSESSPGEDRVKDMSVKIMNYLLSRLELHDCQLSVAEQIKVLQSDVLLNAQGLDVWLG